jgi:hypothetical protein
MLLSMKLLRLPNPHCMAGPKRTWRDEPVCSFSSRMASATIALYLGWVAAFLALPEAALGAMVNDLMIVER